MSECGKEGGREGGMSMRRREKVKGGMRERERESEGGREI